MIVAGGVVRARDRGIVGEATVDFIRQFKVDIGLIGISGIEADGTLRDFDYREVKVARTIIEHSREVWLAADHSKFNRPAMVELARLDQIDTLFTDARRRRRFRRCWPRPTCSAWWRTELAPLLAALAPAGASRLHFAPRSEPRRNGLSAVVASQRAPQEPLRGSRGSVGLGRPGAD